jgi:ATP-binding protein involved in chromosome partitioning
VPFLGAVPLHMKIRELSDEGTPVVARDPEGDHARLFRDVAARTWQRVQAERTTTRQPPKIVME